MASMLKRFLSNRLSSLISVLLFIILWTTWGGPALLQVITRQVTVDELLAAPDAYIDQFVEVQGLIRLGGVVDCAPGPPHEYSEPLRAYLFPNP
jgi:hypothetical protein